MAHGRGRRAAASLFERERELEQVDAALEAAREGRGRLLYFEAHAGIGKSRLLAAAVRQAAESGLETLTARGSELERGHSFGVTLQLLEPPLRDLDEAARQDLLGGAAALALPLLEGEESAAADLDEQLFRLLHGLYWVTSNLAERRPLLVAVDDAHWSDRPSLRFLLYLAQRLPELPVAVVASGRPAEPDAPEDLLRQLKGHATATLVRPAALSPAGVAGVVRRRMPAAEAPFVEACAAVTDGNPYLLGELLADAESSGVEPTAANAGRVGQLAPESVLQAALVRLLRLPTGAAALARAVAVLGHEAEPVRAAALANLESGTAQAASDALVAAEILSPSAPLAFVHPLMHSAIYADIPPAELAATHGRAARLLARGGVSGGTVAAHLLRTAPGGDPWVVEQLRAAAERSLAQGSADSAAHYLRRALAEPPEPEVRPEVLIELGRAESLAGRAEALERLTGALELVQDPRRRAEVLRELGWTLQKRGDMPRAVEAFERGISELERLDGELGAEAAADLELANLQAAHLGAAMMDPAHAEKAHRAVVSLAGKEESALTPGDRGLLSVAAMHNLFRGDSHEDVIALARRAWGQGRLLEEVGSNSHTVWHVIGCLSWADDLDAAEAAVEAALDSAGREGSVTTLALGLYSRSWPRYWRGDLAGSVTDARAAVDAWSGEFEMYLPVAAYWLALGLLELGEIEAAAKAVDFSDAERRWATTNMYGPLLCARGRVDAARGDHAAASDLFEAAGRSVLGAVVANPAVIPWRAYLSEARMATGDREGAARAAEEELALARRFGASRPLGISLRAAGLAAKGDRATALLKDAVDVLRGSRSRLELARALVDQGAALRRQGSRAEARAPLQEGLSMARQFGALVLERRAEDELQASGARPRQEDGAGSNPLTPSEQRVAQMVVDGMTNREIAQTLFVTVQAVRFHLRNTYRKLGVSSREELAEALERL